MKVSCRAKFKFKAAVPAFLGKVEIQLNLINSKNHSGIKCKKTLHWYELCSIWRVNASNKKNAKFSCDTCMEELPNYDFSSNQSQFQTGKANISQDCWWITHTGVEPFAFSFGHKSLNVPIHHIAIDLGSRCSYLEIKRPHRWFLHGAGKWGKIAMW